MLAASRRLTRSFALLAGACVAAVVAAVAPVCAFSPCEFGDECASGVCGRNGICCRAECDPADDCEVNTGVCPPRAPVCTGDCNGDRQVTVAELVRGVGVALGIVPLDGCAGYPPCARPECVTIDRLTRAIESALDGCPAGPTPAPTGRPAPTATPARPAVGTATPAGLSIYGHVQERPGATGYARGWAITLAPLDRTTYLEGTAEPPRFCFEDLPPGIYTVDVTTRCNPFGCWRPVVVELTDAPVSIFISIHPRCGDAMIMARFEHCRAARTERACLAAGGRWGRYPYSQQLGCFCPTGQDGCVCEAGAECLGSCYAALSSSACPRMGICSAEEPWAGCRCVVLDPGVTTGLCSDP